MSRQQPQSRPDELRQELIRLLQDFENKLQDGDLREQVLALVPAVHTLRNLGSSLVPNTYRGAARDRILYYFERYPRTVIAGDELGVVSGISEYARRIRELRVQFGWPIFSGDTARQMAESEESQSSADLFGPDLPQEVVLAMRRDDYVLVGEQDRDAAHRWHTANTIRREDLSVRDRLLKFLRANVGQPVTGEELRYVADKAFDWGRRIRELRTELGWPVATRNSGRPDLPAGMYLLEADRQAPAHDRRIPDPVRVAVLERDEFRCIVCGWTPQTRVPGSTDPRTLLEPHHVEHHAQGGSNELDNLVTLCNVHHDELHAAGINGDRAFRDWVAGRREG
jgi:hypothetical protein